jgi:two-component system chemotaxis response regulator CheY
MVEMKEKKTLNAMVIDDSRAMRTIVGRILKEIGFEIVEAANGREALKLLEKIDLPTIAMVDWNMPEMNGLQFVSEVRSRPKYNGMRIIMVTTETDIKRMSEAMVQGVDEYVMKPFTKEIIIQKLEQLAVSLV